MKFKIFYGWDIILVRANPTLYYCMQILCMVLIFAFMLCGNVGLGFVFSLQVNNHFCLPFRVYSCTIQGTFMLYFVCVIMIQ
jgi:hypothetical protein